MSPSPAARAGLWVAGLGFVADQASKLGLLFGARIGETGPIPLAPFAEFRLVWNYGISYGLFQQHTEWGRWALVALKLGAAVVLSFWLRKAASKLEAAGIGLIIGGAIGNAIDRIVHGAVFDFAHFHVGSFNWYVFNIADAGIVVGVALMLLAQLVNPAAAPEKP